MQFVTEPMPGVPFSANVVYRDIKPTVAITVGLVVCVLTLKQSLAFEQGLPSCISLTEPPFFLILKSGSFGQSDFIKKAIDHLSERV